MAFSFIHILRSIRQSISNQYPEVLRAVAEVASKTKNLELVFTNIKHSQGWIGVYFERTPSLIAFHKGVVRGLSPLRKLDQSSSGYHMNFSAGQLENIQKYGKYPKIRLLRCYGFIYTAPNHYSVSRFRRSTKSCTISPVADCKFYS